MKMDDSQTELCVYFEDFGFLFDAILCASAARSNVTSYENTGAQPWKDHEQILGVKRKKISKSAARSLLGHPRRVCF